MKRLTSVLFALYASCFTLHVSAQYLNKAVEIWPKALPGDGEKKESVWKERPNDGACFFDVSNPTLEAFTPDTAKSNGKAVVVCPGGA